RRHQDGFSHFSHIRCFAECRREPVWMPARRLTRRCTLLLNAGAEPRDVAAETAAAKEETGDRAGDASDAGDVGNARHVSAGEEDAFAGNDAADDGDGDGDAHSNAPRHADDSGPRWAYAARDIVPPGRGSRP